MMPIHARGVYIKQEAAEDPRSMARIQRMMPFIRCATEPVIVDDQGLHDLILAEKGKWHSHGTRGNQVEPVVIFNQYLYHHTPEERERRKREFPELFKGGGPAQYGGYGGFDWRDTGSAAHREKTGQVCQPAYALHSFWGCHFRCAYCNLGHVAHAYVNLEDWCEHIERSFATVEEKSPGQNLFQWDNGSDIVCWEPEYGGTKLLIDLFARQPNRYLELYVGKSDIVDFMLDFDHQGHTVCCWSLSHATQAREIEPRAASMEARLKSARKCQEAGYPVRIRFSPIVPTAGWEQDIRHMIQRMFEEIKPEIITMEPLRYYNYEGLVRDFAPGVIDPDFLEAMKGLSIEQHHLRQFPDELVARIYRVVFAEVLRISPQTPVAFCRERRVIWDAFAEELKKTGQNPDNYVCNCGPYSAGPDPRLVAATA
ncbi:MAG: hypothetical protein RBU25_09705 [Lentisphaeria bacterium]|jgi:hypothetical protein|nr:hypothetical protein [Lentisphaeria bacterium]